MSSPELILASSSPRRIELLDRFKVPFRVVPSKAEELHDHSLRATDLCSLNASRKAEEVAKQFPAAIVLGADTLVTSNGVHFGKPRDEEEAVRMLQQLSGRTHQVVTGVALLQCDSNQRESFAVETRVTFRMLSEQTIRNYIRAVPVLDKAGAYAIQDRGEMLVEKIDGSLTNVIGLPMERLAEALCGWGLITPLERDKIAGSRD